MFSFNPFINQPLCWWLPVLHHQNPDIPDLIIKPLPVLRSICCFKWIITAVVSQSEQLLYQFDRLVWLCWIWGFTSFTAHFTLCQIETQPQWDDSKLFHHRFHTRLFHLFAGSQMKVWKLMLDQYFPLTSYLRETVRSVSAGGTQQDMLRTAAVHWLCVFCIRVLPLCSRPLRGQCWSVAVQVFHSHSHEVCEYPAGHAGAPCSGFIRRNRPDSDSWISVCCSRTDCLYQV